MARSRGVNTTNKSSTEPSFVIRCGTAQVRSGDRADLGTHFGMMSPSNGKPYIMGKVMAPGGKTIGNRTRVLTLILAVVFVVFLTQITVHTHQNGQNEATCQVCQAAHLGSIPSLGTLELCVAPQAVGYVAPFVVAYHDEFFFHDSPSRAPPSFSL